MNHSKEITRKENMITHIEGINDITFGGNNIQDRYVEKAHFANGDLIPYKTLNDLDSEYVYQLEVG